MFSDELKFKWRVFAKAYSPFILIKAIKRSSESPFSHWVMDSSLIWALNLKLINVQRERKVCVQTGLSAHEQSIQ